MLFRSRGARRSSRSVARSSKTVSSLRRVSSFDVAQGDAEHADGSLLRSSCLSGCSGNSNLRPRRGPRPLGLPRRAGKTASFGRASAARAGSGFPEAGEPTGRHPGRLIDIRVLGAGAAGGLRRRFTGSRVSRPSEVAPSGPSPRRERAAAIVRGRTGLPIAATFEPRVAIAPKQIRRRSERRRRGVRGKCRDEPPLLNSRLTGDRQTPRDTASSARRRRAGFATRRTGAASGRAVRRQSVILFLTSRTTNRRC